MHVSLPTFFSQKSMKAFPYKCQNHSGKCVLPITVLSLTLTTVARHQRALQTAAPSSDGTAMMHQWLQVPVAARESGQETEETPSTEPVPHPQAQPCQPLKRTLLAKSQWRDLPNGGHFLPQGFSRRISASGEAALPIVTSVFG